MKKTKALSICVLILGSHGLQSAMNRAEVAVSSWRLPEFLSMAEKRPEALLNTAESYFEESRIKRAKVEPSMAEDWNDRSAILSSLASLWVNRNHKKDISNIKKRAKVLLEKALADDPALLVRDAAAEGVRDILRAQPNLASEWKKTLEVAFLDEKNIIKGEGLFIRETLLSIMYESGIRPSKAVIKSAKQDLNNQVRSYLGQWDSANFQSLKE